MKLVTLNPMHTFLSVEQPLREVFSIYFRLLLKTKNLTAADYARSVGYTPRAAQHWARAETSPPLEVIGEVMIFATECWREHYKTTIKVEEVAAHEQN